jgi:23S rRNA (cytidine1920-2'-O)/16S rRNA (cytidine1409-2'-O)-methyltransferase
VTIKPKKIRLDALLAEKNLAENIQKAGAIIMAGGVEVDGKVIDKPGTPVGTTSEITFKSSNPFVSRGGLKIEPAFAHFNISVEGRVCMDIGASTGGFTDFLLSRGAQKVYAVDVGKNLLHERLKSNPKVVNLEGVNFRYFSSENLKRTIEFVTIDVSFISLENILPNVADFLSENALVLAMVKPQFEAEQKDLRKGVVKDEETRSALISKVIKFSEDTGFVRLGGVDSTVKGPKGNIEHFLLLKYGNPMA